MRFVSATAEAGAAPNREAGQHPAVCIDKLPGNPLQRDTCRTEGLFVICSDIQSSEFQQTFPFDVFLSKDCFALAQPQLQSSTTQTKLKTGSRICASLCSSESGHVTDLQSTLLEHKSEDLHEF